MSNKPNTPIDLSGFTGTENYYRYTQRMVLTDGTRYLADAAGCFWLMDVVASYIPTIPSDEGFAVVSFIRQGEGGYVGITDDIPARRWYAAQAIEWTDFPLDEITMYLEKLTDTEWCLLLTQEH